MDNKDKIDKKIPWFEKIKAIRMSMKYKVNQI